MIRITLDIGRMMGSSSGKNNIPDNVFDSGSNDMNGREEDKDLDLDSTGKGMLRVKMRTPPV